MRRFPLTGYRTYLHIFSAAICGKQLIHPILFSIASSTKMEKNDPKSHP